MKTKVIKLELGEIVDCVSSLMFLAQTSLPARAAYAVSVNQRKLDNEVTGFNHVRQGLVDEFGERDENDALIIVDGKYQFGENQDEFEKEIQTLSETDVELDLFVIPIKELERKEDLSIPPLVLSKLHFMFELDQETEAE